MLNKFQYFSLVFGVIFVGLFFGFSPVLASFSCDTGDLNTDCYITHKKILAPGEVITGSGNIIIKNGGNLTLSSPSVFAIHISGDLTVESGGKITGNLDLLCQNLDIQPGGKIDVTARGYAGGTCSHSHAYNGEGPGAGGGATIRNPYAGGGGAGYGGNGGKGTTLGYTGEISLIDGGLAYGSLLQPSDLGSGGGAARITLNSHSCAAGGNGGGKVKIDVSQTLTLDGSILANGGDGKGYSGDFGSTHGGGGSGGSILINTSTLQGSGSIAANGGRGENLEAYGPHYPRRGAGGGSGGRISIHVVTNNFTGSISAYGGDGYQVGGAETIN